MTSTRIFRTWPFDLFKGVIALLLLALLLLLPLRGRSLLGTQLGALTVLDMPPAAAASAEVTLTGRGIPGTTLEVLAGAASLGTTTVAVDGSWALPATLPPGAYDLRALVLGTGGAILGESATLAWAPAAEATPTAVATTVATAVATDAQTAPVPTLDTPVLAGDRVQFAGSAEPGATVEVLVGERVLGQATAASDGRWSLEAPLAPGDYLLQLRSLDAAGAVAATSPVIPFGVPTPPPAAPPTLDAPVLGDSSVTLAGSGAPGARIEVFSGTTRIGETTVAADGRWSLDATMEPGDYALQVRTLDASGEIVDTSAVLAWSMAAPPAATGLTLGTPLLLTGTATLTGSAIAGTPVEVLANATSLGSAEADVTGTWTLTSTLAPGDYLLQARAGIGTAAPMTSSLLAWSVGEDGSALVVRMPEVSRSGALRLSGVAAPGATVQILVDDVAVGTVTAGEDGTWNVAYEAPAQPSITLAARDIAAGRQTLPLPVQLATAEATSLAASDSLTVTQATTATEAAVQRTTGVSLPVTSTVAAVTDAAAVTSTTALTSVLAAITATTALTGAEAVGAAPATEITATLAATPALSAEAAAPTAVVVAPAPTPTATPLPTATATAPPATSTEVVTPTAVVTAVAADDATPTPVPAPADGQAYVVQSGDWLSSLAAEYLGDPALYPLIVEATNARAATDTSFATISDQNQIEVGQKIWIPARP